jgi:hypothetical protein
MNGIINVPTLKTVDPIKMLRSRQGAQRDRVFAGEVGVSPQFLCDLYKKRREPGPKVLKYLRLERVVCYIPMKGAKT